FDCDWSSDVCSSDLVLLIGAALVGADSRAANSSIVDVPISANALTYALLANPYSHGGNTVFEIFSSSGGLPYGTTVYKYTSAQGVYPASSFLGAWSNPNVVIRPGEGFFLS